MEEELEQIEQKTKEATQAMDELGEKLKHVGKDSRAEAIKKLRDELADLTGTAKKDIP
jgi:F0F1-type ATP synthase membrane subunit b/b'